MKCITRCRSRAFVDISPSVDSGTHTYALNYTVIAGRGLEGSFCDTMLHNLIQKCWIPVTRFVATVRVNVDTRYTDQDTH